MAKTRKYRVVGGLHSRIVNDERVTFRPGDAMLLTRKEAEGLGTSVEPYVDVADDDDDDDQPAVNPTGTPAMVSTEKPPEPRPTEKARRA